MVNSTVVPQFRASEAQQPTVDERSAEDGRIFVVCEYLYSALSAAPSPCSGVARFSTLSTRAPVAAMRLRGAAGAEAEFEDALGVGGGEKVDDAEVRSNDQNWFKGAFRLASRQDEECWPGVHLVARVIVPGEGPSRSKCREQPSDADPSPRWRQRCDRAWRAAPGGFGEIPSVLAVLALSPGSAVPVTRIVDLVWGDAPPPRAEKTLQWHIAQLRKGWVTTR